MEQLFLALKQLGNLSRMHRIKTNLHTYTNAMLSKPEKEDSVSKKMLEEPTLRRDSDERVHSTIK